MRIFTSRFSYKIPSKYIAVGIAVGRPKWELPYECEHLRLLAPYGLFNRLTGEAFKKEYFERLDKIGVKIIEQALESISRKHYNKDVVLLCWEDLRKGKTCHRRYFAEWWLKNTGETIEELEEFLNRPAVEAPTYEQESLF